MERCRRPENRRRVRRAFTLLEALVALVIFAIISVALSLSITTAFQAQDAAQRREEEAGAVRAVFSYLRRDLQSAFISKNNPACVFMANSGAAGGVNNLAAGSLLTLTTLAHRIETDETTMNPAGAGMALGGSANTLTPPQADFMLVRYDIEPSSGSLIRTVSAVPNLEMVGQPVPVPEAVLADRIANMTLRFWDAEQQGWRTDWSYQPPEPTTQDTGQIPTNQAATNTGDTRLPMAVEVTLILLRKDNSPATYTTFIPVVAPNESIVTTQSPTANPTGGAIPGGNAGNAGNQGP